MKKCQFCEAEQGEVHEAHCPEAEIYVPLFNTKAELEKFLRDKTALVKGKTYWYYDGTYYLSHGEYERPDYIPVHYKGGWGLKARYYYYSGTLYAPDDGRCEWAEAIVPLDAATERS